MIDPCTTLICAQLGDHDRPRKRHEDTRQALVLEIQNEALDDRDRPMLPHGAKARAHAVSLAPVAVLGLKLRAAIARASGWQRAREMTFDAVRGGLGG
jgi:hypothetical protein